MKYRKKPVVIDAVQWKPTDNGRQEGGWPIEFARAKMWMVSVVDLSLLIPTLEGEMRASPGDWIIKGVKGEFYPCKPDIFAATYEEVES